MQFVKKQTVNASADRVWQVFAHDFDDAYKWMASVPESHAVANGPQFEGAQSCGRVCSIDGAPGDVKASERFLAYDEQAKTATVRIDFLNANALFPVHHNTLEFSVVDKGHGTCVMTWVFHSKIRLWAYLIWPLLRIGFGIFVGQIIEELTCFVETGEPHSRKLAALKKANSARPQAVASGDR